jgi:hypothetical protein
MKNGCLILTGSVLAVGLLCGCQTHRPAPATRSANATSKDAHATWSNGYVLLHQLMSDEQDVNKLRFFKHEQPDVKDLINRIAKASGEAVKRLEAFNQEGGGVDFKALDLPPGEQTTRDAIASTKERELLGHTGERFELALLLTQAEAMNYGWHLAEVASKNDSRPERARYLTDLGKQLKSFYQEINQLLLSRTKAAPAKD